MDGSLTATILKYFFVISLFLIAVVYFIGLSTDSSSVATALRGLIYAATGRNQSGNFAAYPTGARQP